MHEIDLGPSGTHLSYVGTRYGVIRRTTRAGVERREAAPTPPASLAKYIPIPEKTEFQRDMGNASVTLDRPPYWLNRTGLAFWWSIKILLESGPCYFWRVSHGGKDVIPDSWFSNMHTNFIRNLDDAAKAGKIRPDWGGVRLYEPHPGGHGLHSHLVVRGKMPIKVVQDCATRAGLGYVWVRGKKCDIGSAHYLCKYLMKAAPMRGVRRWACIGHHTGVRKNEIVFQSERIDRIKQYRDVNIVKGMHRYAAYLLAVQQYEEEKATELFGLVNGVKKGLDK